jgi:nucleoid DNA-binding protein/nucleoid-associated protein YgaU
MNHKITFQELVDAIADQSGRSKQFTHDFIKEFATLIRDGLEKDGSVNIAGLGKFELKKMDEREGYNPETEEKITIPAHNKIDFTPYKDLRELVNAPYAHMEPEIMEEDGPADAPEEEETGDATEAKTGTDSPDSDEEQGKKKAPWQEDMESEIDVDEDDPFGLNAKRKANAPYSFEDKSQQDDEEDEEDIVEFGPDISLGDSKEEEASAEETEEPVAEAEAEKEAAAETDTAAPEPKTFTKKPSFRDRSHRRQASGGAFWIIAAAFIILLLAISAWYFMGSQQEAAQDTMATETRAVQNEDNAEEQDQAEEQQAAAAQPEADTETAETEEDASGEDDATQPQDADRQAAAQAQQAADPTDAPPVETITVSAGQTLWGLADDEYQNPYLWPWIYDTNRPNIDDPDIIYTGQLLDIPQRRGQNNQLSNNDSLQVALGYVETYLWYKENNLENARFYLYAAKKYYSRVFEYTDATFDEDDLRFANRAQ